MFWCSPPCSGSLAHSEALPFGFAAAMAAVTALGTVQLWQGLALRRLRHEMTKLPTATTPSKGLPVGVLAPQFDLADTEGGRGSLSAALAAGLPVLVLFLHPGCGPCEFLAAELASWRPRLAGKATILVIGNSNAAANTGWARTHQIGTMLVQRDTEVVAGYRLPGTPSAFLIDTTGRMAAPTAVGTYAIRDLLADTAAHPAPHANL